MLCPAFEKDMRYRCGRETSSEIEEVESKRALFSDASYTESPRCDDWRQMAGAVAQNLAAVVDI
jgi:hypothetical protein